MKRTTVVLDDDDQVVLGVVATYLRTSDMEAIRRSLRLVAMLMDWQDQGGMIELSKGHQRRLLEILR